jgi:hypothetical protein
MTGPTANNYKPASIDAHVVKVAPRPESNFVPFIPRSFLFRGRSKTLFSLASSFGRLRENLEPFQSLLSRHDDRTHSETG